MRKLKSICLIPAIALPLLTCDTYVTQTVTNATRTYITDSPFPYYRVARVDLYIVSVSASLSPDTSASSGSFVTLATPNRRINVLALQNGLHDLLGAVSLPTGTITAVRMVIDTDSSSLTLRSGAVLTGKTTPGIQWQSSAGRPVLSALVNELIDVPAVGGIVVIDYDVGEAFIPPQELDPASKDSGFIFSPVLRAVDANKSGWITGTVRAKSPTGNAVVDASLRLYLGKPSDPEKTWIKLGTAKTDSSGVFRFASVTRSGYWAQFPAHAGKSYIVSIDPPPNSGLGRVLIPNLIVSPTLETSAGVIVLP
jgi:Domain of unknown function (DUF4382)